MKPSDSDPRPSKRGPAAGDVLRLDQALVAKGLVESRAIAQRLILAGEVRVDGETAAKPSQVVSLESRLEIASPPRYVSRGGFKLEAALRAFELGVANKVCADIGASTGGFTDCLLQSGARRVYAIDVGKGILHWKLRQEARVVVMERTNARYLEALPEPIELVSIDASFIALSLLLPRAAAWLVPGGDVVALVKPQFEAGKGAVGKGGVVRDAAVHRQVIESVLAALAAIQLAPRGLICSPLRGPKGNVEFLLWAVKGGGGLDMAPDIDRALRDSAAGAGRVPRNDLVTDAPTPDP